MTFRNDSVNQTFTKKENNSCKSSYQVMLEAVIYNYGTVIVGHTEPQHYSKIRLLSDVDLQEYSGPQTNEQLIISISTHE